MDDNVNRDVISLLLHILYDTLFTVTRIPIEIEVSKASFSGMNRVHVWMILPQYPGQSFSDVYI